MGVPSVVTSLDRLTPIQDDISSFFLGVDQGMISTLIC
jgi:hypothetical protein